MPPEDENVTSTPIEKMLDSKVIATALTTAAIGFLVGLAAKYGIVLGETEIAWLGLILGPIVAAAITFGVGYLKRDERIGALLDFYRRVTLGGVEAVEPPEPDEKTGEISGAPPSR